MIKMKHKLLFVIFFPTLVLLGFIVKFIFDDYAVISQMTEAKKFGDLGRHLNMVMRALREENGAIMLYFLHDRGNQIQATKEAIDIEIQNLRIVMERTTASNDEEKEFFISMRNLLDELTRFSQKRVIVDLDKEDMEEIQSEFDEIENKIIDRIGQASHFAINPQIERINYGILTLMHQNQLNEQLRTLLLVPEITQAVRERIIGIVAEKDAIREIFRDSATEGHLRSYETFLNSSSVANSNKLLNNIIASPDSKEKVSKDRDDRINWWQAQTDRIRALNDVISKFWEEIDATSDSVISEKTSHVWLVIILVASTIILTSLLTFFGLKQLARRLQEEVNILSYSGEEIQHSISQASSGIIETATSVNETTTTVEELKQTAQLTADKSKNVSTVSDEALETLKASEKSLEKTIEEMHHIQTGMSTISTSIIKLSEHSKAIGEIINTVNDLAEQSHLLAVNAAIEAAKAGEHGKGFAVVSQEVRSLADQSKQATIQVRNILSDIQNATNAAVMATEQGSKTVESGMKQSQKMNDSIKSLSQGISKVIQATSQISISSQQQLVAVAQVTVAMGNINDASNQQVEHIRQIETAMGGMNNVANNLKDLINDITGSIFTRTIK